MRREKVIKDAIREPVLNPVDRVSELLFGLLMALTFVGAVSVANAGRDDIEAMFAAALGCNLAWPGDLLLDAGATWCAQAPATRLTTSSATTHGTLGAQGGALAACHGLKGLT